MKGLDSGDNGVNGLESGDNEVKGFAADTLVSAFLVFSKGFKSDVVAVLWFDIAFWDILGNLLHSYNKKISVSSNIQCVSMSGSPYIVAKLVAQNGT